MCVRLGCIMKKLSERISNILKKESRASYTTLPDNNAKQSLLRKLSKNALNLYVKHTDIKHFTKLVLSDPENLEHEKLVQDLINKGEISDIMSDKNIKNLTENDKFLKDLGLD